MATTTTVTPQVEARPKNIFTQGNLVISTNGQIVLVTQDDSTSYSKFSGVCLFGNDIHKTGYYGETWAIECFTQYKGTVTIVAE